MEAFKEKLNEACRYRMADETVDMFLGLMSEVKLKNKEPLIVSGKLDDNFYILKEGIIRFAYFDGQVERTFAFGDTPGDMIVSYHCFEKGLPSFFQYESCGESVVMKVSKKNIDELFQKSRDFANWLFRMYSEQIYVWEMKVSVINGVAEERLEAFIKNRPELFRRVSNRIIASYLGVEQSYLSRIKKRVLSRFKR